MGPKAPVMDRRLWWPYGHHFTKKWVHKVPANQRYCNKECGNFFWAPHMTPVNKHKKMCRVLKKQLRICPKKCPGRMTQFMIDAAKKC